MKRYKVWRMMIAVVLAVSLCAGCSKGTPESGSGAQTDDNEAQNGESGAQGIETGDGNEAASSPEADSAAGEEVIDGAGVTPGWQLHSTDEVTLDWYINYSWFTTGWGDNLVSQTITRETGVNVNFVTPVGNEKEKLNALIASDSLPDIITLGWWEPQITEMIDGGMVYALNELADEYDAYFWQVADPTVVSWYTASDGNLYDYPNSAYTPEDVLTNDNIGSNETFLVRKDIYEAIGSPDMTTTEGFRAAVEKAAEMFPQVGGEPLIPIGSDVFTSEGSNSFDKYLQNFLAIPYEKDGMTYDRNTDPEYLKWLEMFRKLNEEGLLSSDIFIDQRTQMEEKMAAGRYFCMIYQRTDMVNQEKTLYATNPDSIYIAVDGPKNSAGDDHKLPIAGINGWTVTLISKNCDRPDRAIEFLSYLMSEHGQLLTFLGVEGETYDWIDGKAVLREDVAALLNSDRNQYDRVYGADNAYWMLQDNVMQLKWQQELTEPLGQLEEWTYPYKAYIAQYEYVFTSDPDTARLYTSWKELWGSTLPRLLLATDEETFYSIYESYLIEREELGWTKLQEACTEQLRENESRLGISAE